MGELSKGACDYASQKPTQVTIRRVCNGFVISSGMRGEEKIANTLPEALELLRKDME